MPPPLAAELPLTVVLPMVSGPPLNMPPPRPAVLPLIMQLVITKVSLFSLSMPPPALPAWPFLIMKPEIVMVLPETGVRNTRLIMLPSTASTSAPGPLIVTLVSTSSSPLVRLITPDIPLASIVSPLFAMASACRNDPGPLSFVLVTGMMVA
ncbi:MAG: hypothetical protein DMF24_11165 [Verrucomicrobia bacterium]|nr:MAG: hypothetical protein DME90_08715 [Verrucomicrobiota bacterium]PYL60123.1 MAG: hypothetical protein DMF24_11165 [Verrucomicrobiota bacterium]